MRRRASRRALLTIVTSRATPEDRSTPSASAPASTWTSAPERQVYGLPCDVVVAILRSATSDAPDPRLASVLDLVRREWLRIVRARFSNLGDDAEDAVQTALMKLLAPGKLDTLSDPTAVDRWGRSVLVNTALDFLRDGQRLRRRTPTAERAEDGIDLLDLLPAGEPDPEEQVRRAERLVIIRRCLGRLDEAWLRYVEDLPELEVAARVGTTRDAVASRLKRFRQWLRRELEDQP